MTLDHVLAAAQPVLDRWGYTAVFATIFVEGAGIPAPGQTLLVAGGLLAGRGRLSLAPLLATSLAAAAAGNAVGWAIGRYGGRPLLERFAAGERLARIEKLFERSGAGVLALGRFVDGVRQLNGIAAGALGMAPARFHLWNLVGALLWAGFWGLGSYALGRDLEGVLRVYHHLRPLFLSLAVFASGALLAWLLRGRLRRAPP
ncbi:MAG TPA: DedA family protein [Myxococcota bacterium]|nr:DedA family protein [Myxococcota bacterium]